jgi:chromosome segregation ATPase
VKTFAAAGVVAVLLFGAAVHAAGAGDSGGKLYRYKNEHGQVEIGDAVPPERVAGGYEILDAASGRVLDTVAAALTPAELAAKQARDREVEACQENLERVRALYGSLRDIDAAAEQAERSLETRIGHLQASRSLEQRRLEALQQDAAQRERTGRVVTPEMQADMERSQAQIASIDSEIAQRREEQEASRKEFVAERALFERDRCGPEEAAR